MLIDDGSGGRRFAIDGTVLLKIDWALGIKAAGHISGRLRAYLGIGCGIGGVSRWGSGADAGERGEQKQVNKTHRISIGTEVSVVADVSAPATSSAGA